MEELARESETEGGTGDGENCPGGDGIRMAMAGGAFLCSVPPSGNGPMTKRFIKEVGDLASVAGLLLVDAGTTATG